MRKLLLSLLILFMSSSTMVATLSGTIYGGSTLLKVYECTVAPGWDKSN